MEAVYGLILAAAVMVVSGTAVLPTPSALLWSSW